MSNLHIYLVDPNIGDLNVRSGPRLRLQQMRCDATVLWEVVRDHAGSKGEERGSWIPVAACCECWVASECRRGNVEV